MTARPRGLRGSPCTPAVADVAETFGLTPATITITDDGALPVTLVLSPASIDESGARTRATVTAVLSGAVSNEDIVLTVAAAPGTNTVAADYTLAGTTLTIPAGQRSSTGTVTITAVGNGGGCGKQGGDRLGHGERRQRGGGPGGCHPDHRG
ncbi:DUF1735 domain-containing protein [Ruegeria sp.]|uniref:DUF1735 domain-containing protein n=1 Tax=Ruegeria sp. TaxID=1879320 RepID=UPI003B5BCD09